MSFLLCNKFIYIRFIFTETNKIIILVYLFFYLHINQNKTNEVTKLTDIKTLCSFQQRKWEKSHCGGLQASRCKRRNVWERPVGGRPQVFKLCKTQKLSVNYLNYYHNIFYNFLIKKTKKFFFKFYLPHVILNPQKASIAMRFSSIINIIICNVRSENESERPSASNPSNESRVEDANTLVKWKSDEPRYDPNNECVQLTAGGLSTGGCYSSEKRVWRKRKMPKEQRIWSFPRKLGAFRAFYGGQRLQGFLRARRACDVSLRASSCVWKLFYSICIGKLFFFFCL